MTARPLRDIVETLRRWPDASESALLAELPTDEARHALSALLVEERGARDVTAETAQFGARLERAQRLRRMRQVSRSIAERQVTAGADAPAHDELRALERDSREVYGFSRAGGQLHHPGPQGPQGVPTND